MLCITNSKTDPYFNLATEEYLLKNFTADCFMLWQNENAIVVGKHQNALAEINMDYVNSKNIAVVRRISGGGTVFHDLGNLNFTFIKNGHEGHLVDFKKYTLPILEVLQQLSVNAKFQGKNDLTIDGKKISGNAEHIYKKRVLHHGTLLFSSVIDDLQLALKTDPQKYTDKAVKSIRSRVTNIKEHLGENMDIMEFRDLIFQHIMKIFPHSKAYELSPYDTKSINKLRKEKYLTWEWNFGYSPKYDFKKSFNVNGELIQVYLNVSGGIIQMARIDGNFSNKDDLRKIQKILTGSKHDKSVLLTKLRKAPLSDYFHSTITSEEFIRGIF